MVKNFFALVGVIAVISALTLAYGNFFSAPSTAADTSVVITDAGFSPSVVNISVGDTVRWTNKTNIGVNFKVEDHIVGNIEPDKFVDHKFTQAGSFTASSGGAKGGIEMTVNVAAAPAATSTPKPAPTQTPIPTATSTPKPAPTQTPVPTKVPVTVQLPCKLDKIATWSEVNSAGPQRLEIGGASGVQHADYYPDRQIPAVSYILPKGGAVRIWFGFGSDWQGDGPECEGFDWKSDTIRYAKDRAGQNHAGLVIDLRNGTPTIIANTLNLSEQAVKDLLAKHRASQSGTVGEPVLGPGVSFGSTTGPSGGAGQPGCPPSVRQEFKTPTDATFTGPAVVNPWWNNGRPSFGQTQVKVKLDPGQTITFLQMMGDAFPYENNGACNANLQSEFDKTGHDPKTVDDLRNNKDPNGNPTPLVR